MTKKKTTNPGDNGSPEIQSPAYMKHVHKHMEEIATALDKITDLTKNHGDAFTYVLVAMPYTTDGDNATVHHGLVGGQQPPGSIQILVHALSTWAVQNHATFGTWIAADKRVQEMIESNEGKLLKTLLENKKESTELAAKNSGKPPAMKIVKSSPGGQPGDSPADNGVTDKDTPGSKLTKKELEEIDKLVNESDDQEKKE